MSTRTSTHVLLPILCALCSCSSEKSSATVTAGTGGAQVTTGGSSNDADVANLGGSTGELGGASSDPASLGGNLATAGESAVGAAGGSTSQGGVASTGGAPATGGATFSPGFPSQCSPKAKIGQSQALPISSFDTESRFAAITPDEQTLVWTTQGTSGVTINVVDRVSSSASWNTVQTIADVPAADGRVTITPNGLTLAYVDSATRRQFASMSRSDRSSSFQLDPSKSGLDFVVQNSESLLATGESYAYPLFGPYMTTFYYGVRSAAGDYKWYVAGRFEVQGVFSEGAPIAFTKAPGAALVLSGVASDENTLLFVDPNTSEASWSFYDEASIAFGSFSSLGSLGFVQPNQSCTRLYGGVQGSVSWTQLQ